MDNKKPKLLVYGDLCIPESAISFISIRRGLSFNISKPTQFEMFVKTHDGSSHRMFVGEDVIDNIKQFIVDFYKDYDFIELRENKVAKQLEEDILKGESEYMASPEVLMKLNRVEGKPEPSVKVTPVPQAVPVTIEEEKLVLEMAEKILNEEKPKRTRKKKQEE